MAKKVFGGDTPLEAFPYSEEFKNLTLESLRNREGRPEHEYWFRMAMTRVDFQRRYFMPALEFFVGCADKDVLELGCGTGPASVAMAEHGARVTAIDIDPKMIHAATLRVRDHGQSDRVRVVSMVLNDGDGMAPGRLASNYFGFGDAIYGTGRMHARLFTNHGMDSSWRSVQEIIPALQTNQSVHLNLNSYSILGVDVRLPIPEEVRLMKILVYWDEPYYSSNIANVQAVLRRTLGTNCNATYWPVASQTSNNEGGNWLHFVLDSSQSVGGGGTGPNFTPMVAERCYQLDINGLNVPNGQGGAGTRRVYVTWFWEDLGRDDLDGPCRHGIGGCDVDEADYLYFH